MRTVKFIFGLILLFGLLAPVNADTAIFLKSRYESSSGRILLGDIASIQTDGNNLSVIKSVSFNLNDLKDGTIDKSEVRKRLAGVAGNSVMIYGNATRIIRKSDVQNLYNPKSSHSAYVKKGASVTFFVNNNGIQLETFGTTLKGGYIGEVIPVKINKYRVVKGILTSDSRVELNL